MSYRYNLVIYHTITPLHVGCGQDVGVVDLPVIRDRTTGYPFIPGSGIRGALRWRFEERCRSGAGKENLPANYFGPEVAAREAEGETSEVEERYAGCVAVHDAHLVLFPVRSDRGLFLWITCPAVLDRLAKDLAVFQVPENAWSCQGLLGPGEEAFIGPEELGVSLYLEEYHFAAAEGQPDAVKMLATWAEQAETTLGLPGLAYRTVLVSDRTFFHFVQHATLIQQHNRLDSAKTVEPGGLFSVEAVPPEALFYGLLGAIEPRAPKAPKKKAEEILTDLWTALAPAECSAEAPAVLHLGGQESTGLGVTRLVKGAG